ncbi:nitrite reductase (NAD(P)H) small subunit [Deinococcus sp. AJ005]|uniref:nitrite reductase (NAD(P)H) small subunit n=1 Tax=Deinococcus sp. AJ005 TaxID=2652443 RepID=UPI001CF6D2BA|nr:nitrite reductase (NAD(P)H) small subunit [Deinococcus sp. AJ005]
MCGLADILPGLGVCALVEGRQIAVFHVAGRVCAVGNRNPFTGADVISRGLTGSYRSGDAEERPKVASPLLKHTFDLATEQALDHADMTLPTYSARVEGGEVWIGLVD